MDLFIKVFRSRSSKLLDLGSFVKGKRHGTGKFLYANGDLYDGQWEGDLKHGQGVYIYASSGSKVYDLIIIFNEIQF